MTVQLPAEPPVELRVESCRRDVDACMDLCRFVLEQAGMETSIERCRVELAADEVHLSYAYYYDPYSQGWCL